MSSSIDSTRFKCPYCTPDRFFSRRHDRDRHIQTKHLNERPFTCPRKGCHLASNRKDQVRRHLKCHPMCVQFVLENAHDAKVGAIMDRIYPADQSSSSWVALFKADMAADKVVDVSLDQMQRLPTTDALMMDYSPADIVVDLPTHNEPLIPTMPPLLNTTNLPPILTTNLPGILSPNITTPLQPNSTPTHQVWPGAHRDPSPLIANPAHQGWPVAHLESNLSTPLGSITTPTHHGWPGIHLESTVPLVPNTTPTHQGWPGAHTANSVPVSHSEYWIPRGGFSTNNISVNNMYVHEHHQMEPNTTEEMDICTTLERMELETGDVAHSMPTRLFSQSTLDRLVNESTGCTSSLERMLAPPASTSTPTMRTDSLDRLLSTPGPLATPGFVAGGSNNEMRRDSLDRLLEIPFSTPSNSQQQHPTDSLDRLLSSTHYAEQQQSFHSHNLLTNAPLDWNSKQLPLPLPPQRSDSLLMGYAMYCNMLDADMDTGSEMMSVDSLSRELHR